MEAGAYCSGLAAELLEGGPGWGVREATSCFVDVSGFTRLNERLGAAGPEGTEVVKQAVSAVFDGLIRAAAEHGGDVLTFAGDALLVLFTGPDHGRRGAAAAAAMQRFVKGLASVPTPLGPVRLRMSAGVESGADAHLLVGEERRALMDLGPGASGAARWEAAARAGEVLVGPELSRALPPAWLRPGSAPKSMRLDLRRAVLDGAAAATATESTSVAPGAALQFVPPALRNDVATGVEAAEHRSVSVAFVALDAPELLPEAAGLRTLHADLCAATAMVEQVCATHAVTWLECDVVPGAARWILVAGAPVADEDDDRRLLRAVADVVEQGVGHRARAGVQRGRVFVADVGNPVRRTYNLMGDAMNVAARLAAQAEAGQTLVAVDALPGRGDAVAASGAEHLRLKGRAAALPAVRLEPAGLRAAAEVRPAPTELVAALVGRHDEVVEVVDALAARRRVAVVADAGTGKSRLAAEAESRTGGEWTWVRGDSVRRNVPFGAVRPWVRQLLELDRQSLPDAVDPVHHPWLPLLADVTGDVVPSTPQVDALDPAFRRDRLLALLDEVRLWRRVADTVAFEDLHWFDDASAGVAALYLRTAAGRSAAVVVTRPADEVAGVLDEVDVVVELQPLPRPEARRLALEVVGDTPLADAELDALVDQAAGNPLFLVELAKEWSQGAGAVPGSVEQVLAARLDRLSTQARDVVRRLAVLGARAPRWLVDVVASPDEVAAAAESGAAAFVLVDDEGSRFAHDLLREAAYRALPVGRRRQVHRKVAVRLVGEPGAKSFDIARHWDLSGEPDETWVWSRRAAADAAAAGAFLEAATFLDAAARAGSRLDQVETMERVAVLDQLADLSDRLGRFDAALDAVADAMSLAQEPSQRAELSARRARVQERSGRYRAALGTTSRALRLAETVHRDDLVARNLLVRAVVRYYQGRLEDARSLSESALSRARACDDLALQAQAHLQLEMCCEALGHPDREAHERSAMDLLTLLDDPVGLGNLLLNRSVGEFNRSEWSLSLATCDRAAAEYLRGGDVVGAALARNNEADTLTFQHRLKPAGGLFEEVRRQCRAAGYEHGVYIALSGQSRVAAWQGDLGLADRLLAETLCGFEEVGMPDLVADTLLRRAEWFLLAGDTRAALVAVAQSRELLADLPETGLLPCTAWRVEASALFAEGDISAAGTAFGRAVVAAAGVAFHYEEAVAELGLAACGDDVENRRRRARSIFRQLGVLAPPPSVPVPPS